jgi:hypothetical protein
VSLRFMFSNICYDFFILKHIFGHDMTKLLFCFLIFSAGQ